MKYILYLMLICAIALPALGQTQTQAQAPLLAPPGWQAQADSAKNDTGAIRPAIQTVDEKGKIKIVKRRIDYTNFVILAVGMMAFVALILGTTQAWNPGGRAP
jgi:hypothetical protein